MWMLHAHNGCESATSMCSASRLCMSPFMPVGVEVYELFSDLLNWNGNQIMWLIFKLFKSNMEVCRWCMANFKSIGLELYEKYVVKRFSLFFEKSKWRPNHMIKHFLGSNLKVLHMEIVYANFHINRSATLWEEIFLTCLASYSKNQNGGQTTWPTNFLGSNSIVLQV